MRRRYGVILLEANELIFRIYEVYESEWKLIHFQSTPLQLTLSSPAPNTTFVMEKIAEFFSTEQAQHIAEWKAASRHLPQKVTEEIAGASGIKMEAISPNREQELLCKGLFTELW